MGIKDAYLTLKKLPMRNVLLDCLDLGDWWAFLFHSKPIPKDDWLIGACYDTVHKDSGIISYISATPDNIERLNSGKRIDIKRFNY